MTSQLIANETITSKWIIVEQNKWGLKISETNFMFVIINPLEDGKYELKYMDAELKDYTSKEKRDVRSEYGINIQAHRQLALKIMEHYGHYEWIEIVPNKAALIKELSEATSFDLKKLKQLVEF